MILHAIDMALGVAWARHAAITASTSAARDNTYAAYAAYIRNYAPLQPVDTRCGGYGKTHARAYARACAPPKD
jgi:hypothetical protein